MKKILDLIYLCTTIDKNHLRRCSTSYRAKKNKKTFLKVFGQVLIKYSYVCVSEVRNTSFFENSYLLNGWPNSVLLFGIYGPLSLDLWKYSASTEFKDQTFSENSTFFCASGVPHYSKVIQNSEVFWATESIDWIYLRVLL